MYSIFVFDKLAKKQSCSDCPWTHPPTGTHVVHIGNIRFIGLKIWFIEGKFSDSIFELYTEILYFSIEFTISPEYRSKPTSKSNDLRPCECCKIKDRVWRIFFFNITERISQYQSSFCVSIAHFDRFAIVHCNNITRFIGIV